MTGRSSRMSAPNAPWDDYLADLWVSPAQNGPGIVLIGPRAVDCYSAAARISDSASVTRARMFERIVSRPAQTAFVAFEMEVSCDLS